MRECVSVSVCVSVHARAYVPPKLQEIRVPAAVGPAARSGSVTIGIPVNLRTITHVAKQM